MKIIIAAMLLIVILELIGCKHHATNASQNNIHRELWGNWSNDRGCNATFIHRDNNLILSSFRNNQYYFKDIALTTQKNGIITYFTAPTIKFNGNYVEGVLIINNYCQEPLYKIGN
ncbi:MAG: hypothetical protein KBD37_02455 [Burkholderiales bacterium]|nr:hypothetical protein [Burkholderiales bacterium]